MKKSEVRNAVLNGKVTLGMLRTAFTKMRQFPSWERSTVNKGLTKEQAIGVLKTAIEADTRPDDTVMNGRRDALTATNVIREVGFEAMLQ